MNKDLIKRNKNIRKHRPLTPNDTLYFIYESEKIFQLCFKSRGCKNFLAGSCIMCDYGIGRNLTPKELEIAFDKAMLDAKNPINILLLNSYGSILDNFEISNKCFKVLLKKLKDTNIKNIRFETHYTTITKEKLNLIKSELKDRNISFELGLESASSRVRKNYLLKQINNKDFKERIKLIHSFGMQVVVNLLVGTPFLTPKKQIDDVLDSIKWSIKNKVDEIVLFPINIKPYTLLNSLYKEKKYDVISHWLLIEVLNRIDVENLSKIYLAWYGNRKLDYNTIFPKSCLNCNDKIFNFYNMFLKDNDGLTRKKLIEDLLNNKCDCYCKW